MTSKYGCENFSLEFRDLQATTMSLDASGQYALLAGRKYLGILDLAGSSGDLLVRIPYGGKYEISSTQWSSLHNANVLAVASSQRCDIFELTDSAELKCTYRLKCHSRVITDIDWSCTQPNLLATSSFDSFVHIWDIRIPRQAGTEKPQQSLSALDGASSVRWNKWKTDMLASCDGGHVKIWDMRKPTTPSEYIAAHASKINGLEWVGSDMIITAAQDCTVKFSRLSAQGPVKAKGPFLTLSAPVWRARPAPFGRGIVTQCVPILRRDSGLLSLWDWKRFTSPIFTFQAHDIVEFSWKRSASFDLITWSRDQILRVWTLPTEIVELCGEESRTLNRRSSMNISNENEDAVEDKAEELFEEDGEDGEYANNASNNVNEDSSPKNKEGSLERRLHRRKSLTTPNIVKRDELLKKEFDAVAESKPDAVIFEQVEIERGMLRFSWRTDPKLRSLAVGIVTTFPLNYPATAPQFLVTSSGSDVDKGQILTTLRQTATQCARRKEPCLSACINQFAAYMNLIKPVDIPDDFSAFPSRGVSNVPFPRTSGARFCSVGVLICFGRPSYLRRVKINCDTGTPRSLSALGPFLSQLTHDNDEISSRRRSRRGERKRAGLVTIFDCSQLLPFSRDLAAGYQHLAKPRDRQAICLDNEKKAGGTRVAHAWQAAAIVAKYAANSSFTKFGHRANEIASLNSSDASDDDEDVNWIHHHPLGSKLINSIIQHYASHGDVQTAASIACVFTEQNNPGGHSNLSQQSHSPNGHYGSGDQLGFSSRNGSGTPRSTQLKQPRLTVPKWWTKGMSSPYHTVHSSDTLHGVVVCPLSESFFRQHRSNSWSDSLDDAKAIQSIHEAGLHNGGISGVSSNGGLSAHSFTNGFLGRGSVMPRGSILNPSMGRVYDCYKKSYAEILYRWGHLQQRAEVLKCLTEGVDSSFLLKQGVDIVIQCKVCDQPARGPFCLKCKRIVSFCAICHAPTKGLSTYCLACGHGGHSGHMLQWFQTLKKTTCATGCGCKCIENINNFKKM